MCRGLAGEMLAGEIEELDIPPRGEAISQAVALKDRLEAKIAEACGEFDAEGLWDLDAATSMTAWLRQHGSMTGKDAGRLSAMAKRLRELPVTASAFRSGELSSGQVQAILSKLKRHTRGLFAEHEAEVVPQLVGLSVIDTARAMAYWAAHAEATVDDPEPPERDRALHLSQVLDGSWVLDGEFDPESGEIISTAIRLAQSQDSQAEPARSPAQAKADSLTDVCRFFLDHQHHLAGGRHRPHVNVRIDLEGLEAGRGGHIVDGPFLDGPSLAALVCDSAFHRFIVAGRSAVLDYGSATRTISAPLWNALVLRDEHCRFPGCDRPASWCEGHHVIPVEHQGPTCLSNLALVCSRHHHRLHQPGWEAKLRPDAALEVTDPHGRHWVTTPP